MKLIVDNPDYPKDYEFEVWGLGIFTNNGQEHTITDEVQLDFYRSIYNEDPPNSLTVGGGTSNPAPVADSTEEDS